MWEGTSPCERGGSYCSSEKCQPDKRPEIAAVNYEMHPWSENDEQGLWQHQTMILWCIRPNMQNVGLQQSQSYHEEKQQQHIQVDKTDRVAVSVLYSVRRSPHGWPVSPSLGHS